MEVNFLSMKKVLFLIGGRSGEHEISLISGKHVLKALDRKKFEAIIVIIQKNGVMTLANEADLQKLPDNPKEVRTPAGETISIRPFSFKDQKPCILTEGKSYPFDLAFPILHGPGGEDGTIQGLFEFANVPVVGCGVKSSAICMDKAMTKILCKEAELPIVPFLQLYRGEKTPELAWDFPVFVKPAHLGSSLGVSKVKTQAALEKALAEAFALDTKIMIEPAIDGREIEIAVFGSRDKLTASPAGEIKCKTEFYSYDAKYVDLDAAELIYPAPLEPKKLQELQEISKAIFKTLDCNGMARIDFFYTKKGEFLLNEVNTIPGFTPISMYPKLMSLAGMSYPELITGLIESSSKD